jgi:F-type H+-transporting ATPase subunit b
MPDGAAARMTRSVQVWGTALALFGAAILPSGRADAAERGMPQLHIPDFMPQVFWLVIWFVILYLLMSKLGLPRIEAIMEARRSRREDDLARAAQLKTDAEAASAAYQKALADARAQAQATLKATADRMAAEAAERQRTLAATLGQQIEEAERRIVASKEEALAEIRNVAVDVGRAVVEKLTGSVPDSARMMAAVDRSLNGQAR